MIIALTVVDGKIRFDRSFILFKVMLLLAIYMRRQKHILDVLIYANEM